MTITPKAIKPVIRNFIKQQKYEKHYHNCTRHTYVTKPDSFINAIYYNERVHCRDYHL